MKSVTVAAFNSLSEAEPLQERLIMAGIAAEICKESQLETLLDYSRVGAGFRVEVPRENFEMALQLVYDWNVTGTVEAPILGDIPSNVSESQIRDSNSNPPAPH